MGHSRIFVAKCYVFTYILPMIESDTYRQIVTELVRAVGSREAKRLLAAAGLAPSTAQQIVGGSYPTIGRHVGETIKQVFEGVSKPAS
jgi:hypothetical protein